MNWKECRRKRYRSDSKYFLGFFWKDWNKKRRNTSGTIIGTLRESRNNSHLNMRQEWYALYSYSGAQFQCTDKCFKLEVGLQTSHIYLLTYLLTPCSRVLLEKLTGSQLVNKFPAFYGTRRFITAFTSARHLSLSTNMYRVSILPCARERHLIV